MLSAFIHGFILAFGLIIPLGVQNIFIFNQGAIQPKFRYALPSVLTASVCDTILILVAVLGLTLIVLHIAWLREVIYAVGFCFLLYMGWVTWNSHSATIKKRAEPLSAKRQTLFALSVSLLNPHALLDTIGVIGTNSLFFIGKAKVAYTLACLLVSWCWFFGLAIAGRVLHKLDQTGLWLRIVNKVSAVIIWGVASYMGWQLINLLKIGNLFL